MNETVRYSERLWPAWWLWLVAVLVGGSTFSTAFFPISVTYGVLMLILGIGVCVGALVATTPRIEVTDEWLRVGRARIERRHLGRVVAHRDAAAREQLGPGFDARSYQCIRGWIGPVVTAEVTDERDAKPYWLFSTRYPEQLLSALGSREPVQQAAVSFSE